MTQEEGRAEEVGRCHCEEPGKRCEELPQVAILALGQHVPSRAEVLRAFCRRWVDWQGKNKGHCVMQEVWLAVELALGDSSLETSILGSHQEPHWKIIEISSFGLWPSFHSYADLEKLEISWTRDAFIGCFMLQGHHWFLQTAGLGV